MSAVFNTLTSPTIEDAAGTGNEQTPSQPGVQPDASAIFSKLPPSAAAPMGQPQAGGSGSPARGPMANIMAAVMRGAAMVQGQEQAKRVAASQQAGNSRMSVTLKPSQDGGPPMVTVKDAPADLLNGTQDQDVADAYNTPRQQVEAKLAGQQAAPQAAPAAAPQSAPAPTAPPGDDHPLEQVAKSLDSAGIHIPRPWAPVDLSSEDKILAEARADGIPNAKDVAHDTWNLLKAGRITPDEVKQNIANLRAHRIEVESQHLNAALAPQREAAAASARAANEQLAAQRLTDSEHKQVLKDKLDMAKGADWTNIVPERWDEFMDAQNTTGVPFTDFERRRIHMIAQAKVDEDFAEFISNPKKFELGTFDSWDEAKAAWAHPVTDSQDKQGHAAWKAAHTLVIRKATDDQKMNDLRDARLELIQQRMEKATEEKPVPLSRGDVKDMSANEILALDPKRTKEYDLVLERKESFLSKDIQDRTDMRDQAKAQAQAILAKPPDRKQFGDEEQLAGLNAKAIVESRRIKEANTELQLIRQQRAARRGKPVAAAPAPKAAPAPAPSSGRLLSKDEALAKMNQ